MSMFEGSRSPVDIVLRGAIVTLTLATAYIHMTLGSMLFLANAASYAVLAAAMVAPIGIVARNRWLVRAALVAFAAATIVGWAIMGPRFWLAYLDKGIEVALIALLVAEMFRHDGGPLGVVRRGIDLAVSILRFPFARRGEA